MDEKTKKEILKQIDICQQSAKNNFEICSESYTEINALLYHITELVRNIN